MITKQVEAVIGRERELAAVNAFVESIPDGPRALLFEGQAGIGKTTIWFEGVRTAEAHGCRVLQARPAEAEASLSYAALADLVGAAYDDTRGELPVPQQRAFDTALLRATTDEPADPRTTATALVGVLTALAADRPVVVAIDDVQWLDPASKRALAFAARRLPPGLGLLVARRATGDEAPPLGLSQAFPDDRLARLLVGPLSLAALHHVIRGRLDTPLARPMLLRIEEASGGNPFFALEIARALAQDAGEGPGVPLPIPETLQELVAARMRAVSNAASEVLRVAAALARPSVPALEKALGRELGGALVEAEEAGVVTVANGRIQFTHPLLASTVYATIPGEERRRLHRRLSEVSPDEEERARHLGLSATEPDDATASALERAAESATRRGAHVGAAELFQQSRRLTPVHRRHELARRTLGEAVALFAVGDVVRARLLAESAVAAASPGSLSAEGLVLLARIAEVDASPRTTADYLEQALVEARDDRVLAGRVHASLSLAYHHTDPELAAEHAELALETLDEQHEPELVASALINKLWNEAAIGHGARLELLDRALALEQKAAFTSRSGMPLAWFVCTDDFESVRARAQMDDEWYRERGEEGDAAIRLAFLAAAELGAGETTLADQYIEQSCQALDQLDARGLWAWPFCVRSFVDAHRGRIERARATLLPIIEDFEGTGTRSGWPSTAGRT